MEKDFFENYWKASEYVGWMMWTGWIPFVWLGVVPEAQFHWDNMQEILICSISNGISDGYLNEEFYKEYFTP